MSRQVKKDVKSGGKVIGTISYDEPTTFEEASEMFGATVALDYFLYGLMVKKMNSARSKLTSTAVPKDILQALKNNPELLNALRAKLAEKEQ